MGTTPVGGKGRALAEHSGHYGYNGIRDKHVSTDLTMGPSCKMCKNRMSGLSLLRSRWMKVRVSCTSTDGTSVKRSVRPCQILSPSERYVELRYSAAVVSAVNRDTDTKMELGNRILTHSAIWGIRRAASLRVPTSITKPPSRRVGRRALSRRNAAAAAADLRYETGGMFSQPSVVPGRDCGGRKKHCALQCAQKRLSTRR